jgi:hypothetical protein
MSKKLDFAVQFANFCKNRNVEPREVAELIRLINRAFKAGEHDANYGTDKADPWYKKVEAQAAKLGMKTYWPGLYPAFNDVTDNTNVHVPCDA